MDLKTERAELARIVATFPTEFRLRGVSDSRFRIDELGSFFSDYSGFQIVVQVWNEEREEWLDYTRYSVERLRGLAADL